MKPSLLHRLHSARAWAFTALILLSMASPMNAANLYWEGVGESQSPTPGPQWEIWQTAANWDTAADGSGGAPGAAPIIGDIAIFNTTVNNGTRGARLNASLSIGGLIFNNTGTTGIASDTSTRRSLTIVSGITMANNAGSVTFGTGSRPLNVTLSASQTWLNNNSSSTLSHLANGSGSGATTLGLGINTLTVDGVGATTLNSDNIIGTAATAFIKNGSGVLTFNSAGATFLGDVQINAGILRAIAGNSDNALSALGTGNLVLAGGELQLASGTSRTPGNITTVTANSTITSDRTSSPFNGLNYTLGTLSIGAQTLTIQPSAAITGGNSQITFAATTLTGNATFNVTNGGAASARLNLGAIGGGFGITKNGSGTLRLDAAGTYNGATIVNAGTFQLNTSNALPETAVTLGAAILDAATFTDTLGTLDVTAAATITLGTGAALAFADSDAINWAGGTLNITGTLGPTSIRFGTDNTGLSVAQCALISVNGGGLGTYTLDNSGFLIAGSPEINVTQDGNIPNGGTRSFGSLSIGSNTSLIFTISNTGLTALNLTGTPPNYVVISGANASDFVVTAQPATPVASGGGNTTFTVRFAPLGTLGGSRNAVLTLLNNDSDEGTFTVNVSGTAVAAPPPIGLVTSTLTVGAPFGAFNRLSVTIDPDLLASSSDTTDLTGTIDMTVNINPVTGKTSLLTLSAGRVNGTDMDFSAFGYNISTDNLSAAVATVNPPGSVNPDTGIFAANQHGFVIDQGTFSGTAVGNPVNITVSPSNSFSGLGTGNGNLTLTPAGTSGPYKLFNAVVTLPVAVSETEDANGIQVIITGTGTIKATGQIQIPSSEFNAWMLAQGATSFNPNNDTAANGASDGIKWALGLASLSSNPLPFLLKPHPTLPGTFTVSLPPSGTVAPLTVESSPNLLPPWTTVPAGQLSSGVNPIPIGSSGTINITPTAANRIFLRMRANP